METSSNLSRFRFRDHQENENSTQSNTSSDISSVSSDPDDESDLKSMTAKGIKHLCSELLELKEQSDEDFHRNIFFNYAAFVRVFDEVKSMENQLMQLKNQISLQRGFVTDLIDGIYLKALSKETIESVVEGSVIAEPSPLSELEVHISNVSETLDTLLIEHRIDEAITILELEDANYQELKFDDESPSDVLMLYNSVISEKKVMLTLQLTLLAENPRIGAAELQKTLVGLHKLGDSHLVTQLLLQYYHSRIATGVHNLQRSKTHLHGVYIRELAKFVFSTISQAARSFVMIYGEALPYASEFIQWASAETEAFVAYFSKYVKSISDVSGGLSKAVQAMQFALSCCSLLETQRLELRPCLVKHIRPCMEEVLQTHVGHFKKVIGMFTASDAWVLGRYLVSGIVNEGGPTMVLRKQPEYLQLTNSGRKFLTLLQAIIADVTPLVSLQMEGYILRGLMDLFTEYIAILERAMNPETNVTMKGGPRINLAVSLPQQVSVLANLSTLQDFFSDTVSIIFRDINRSVGSQQRQLNSCILFIQEANGRLRTHFCQQLIYKMISLKTSSAPTPETCTDDAGYHSTLHNVMPSVAFRGLFVALWSLNKLAEDDVFELDWLMELLRELIETIFAWVSNDKQIWAPDKEYFTGQNSDIYDQFVLDIHFLIEIARHGGYFSNYPSVLLTLMNSAFISAGLDPKRDLDDYGWAKNASTEAIQRLLEIQKTKSLLNDKPISVSEEEENENQIMYASGRSSAEDSLVSEEDAVAKDTESNPLQAINLIDSFGELEDAYEERASGEHDDTTEFVINKLEEDT